MKRSTETQVIVRKWGKNLAVRIPIQIIHAQNLTIGSVIDLDSIRVVRKRRYKLDELMARFKPKHRHGEWDLGDPVGSEKW